MKKIYLDHSATTPVDKKVLQVILPYFSYKFGNPSSIHFLGQEAAQAVDKAREKVSDYLGCGPDEIIFTSGATESNNIIIKGLVKKINNENNFKPHIITSQIEHSAVLEPCTELIRDGLAEITFVKPQKNGVILVEDIEKAIKENTVLISIMYVNNEVGTIQPIKEIGKIVKKINEHNFNEWRKRGGEKNNNKPQRIYFHTDATQALNFLDCNVKKNNLDFLSLSGHKIYGPKGIGAFYIKNGISLRPLILGGHQEKNIRNGTLNTPGIVGLGEAITQLSSKNFEKNNLKIKSLRDEFISGILKNIPKTILNTDLNKSVPSHAHFTFLGVEGESILIALDLAGICVSTGSACASGSLKPSHVLLAMGIKPEIAHSSIRFTLGKYTTKEEIRKTIVIVSKIIKKLRKISKNITF